MATSSSNPHRNILRRLPPALSIDSAHTPTSRPLFPPERDALATLNKLKEFLANAPTRWSPPDAPGSIPFPNPSPRPALNRFSLPSNEYVTCVLWQGQYYISGTDIVRSLVFRFEAFGRPVRNMKKFEEGVFSDLRNLKPGTDATLEEPKSAFLDLLYKYQCIRTQKKQKVFFWFSVPHDRLFFDALERDIKRESMGTEPASMVTSEPALSFKPNLSSGKTLWEEWMSRVKKLQESGELKDEPETLIATPTGDGQQVWGGMFELFEGSPAYKQRRKRRSPVHGHGQTRNNTVDTPHLTPDFGDASGRRQGGLVRSNSLGTPRYENVKREPESHSFYPSSVPNHSSPNVSLLPSHSQATSTSPYPLPFGSSGENMLLDQTAHVVRSHSATGYHRPQQDPSASSSIPTSMSTRPGYNPYPRPQARITTQPRHSSMLNNAATTGAIGALPIQQQQQQPNQSHVYAPTHAPYVSQTQTQQTLTVPINLQDTYSSSVSNSPSIQAGAVAGENITGNLGNEPNFRAFGCLACGKMFQRPENWRNHVNEHSRIGESKLDQDIVECYTQVLPGQHLEDAVVPPAWALQAQTQAQGQAQGSSTPNSHYGDGSLPTATVTVSEPANYVTGSGASAAIMQTSAWVNSPFSSSGSTRSGIPPSPSSSPSGSIHASAHHHGSYGQRTEYTHRPPVRNPAYEGASSSGFYPLQQQQQMQRSETPSMESRPHTASSYDSAANYAVRHPGGGRQGANVDVDTPTPYGRHSSAPVNVSSSQGQVSGMYGVQQQQQQQQQQQGSSSFYYSANQGSDATSAYKGSPPSMEDYHPSSGVQYATAPGNAGGYAPSGYNDGSTRPAWGSGSGTGTEYHSTPSPPDTYPGPGPAVAESSQRLHSQLSNSMQGVMDSDESMRYYHASTAS